MPVVLAVIAVGGMLGAAGRYGVSLAVPTAADGLPWSTLLVNTTGCLLIGILMPLVLRADGAHRLVRPFLGVGVLGGYTTFSAYSLDAYTLVGDGRPVMTLAYLLGTVLAALVAVQVGFLLTGGTASGHGAAATGRAGAAGEPDEAAGQRGPG